MKSRKLPTWVIIVSVAVSMFVLVVYIIMGIPSRKIEVTGNVVDNAYNNYIAGGQMCRIEDKLYLNYEKNSFNYGCIEISNKGAKRLFWGYDIVANPFIGDLYVNDNKLYRSKYSLEYYDFELGELMKIEHGRDYSMNYQMKGDSIFFIRENNLLMKNGENETVLLTNINYHYYIVDDIILYKNLYENTVGAFNMTTGENRFLFSAETYCVMYENGYVLFEAFSEETICKYKFDGSEEIQVIAKGDDFNVYNNKVYVSSESGVAVYDLFSNEEQILYTGAALDSYIFDDMWVYVRISESKVIRVSNDGEIVEKVI